MSVAETQAGKAGGQSPQQEVSPLARQIIDKITASQHPVSMSYLATIVFPGTAIDDAKRLLTPYLAEAKRFVTRDGQTAVVTTPGRYGGKEFSLVPNHKPPQNGVVWTRGAHPDTQERLNGKSVAASDMSRLVALAQEGSKEAFGRIYAVFYPKIVSYLRYHLNGNSDIAQDLASDIFLKTMDKLSTYQAMDNIPFTAWVYRIAHNHLVDYLRTNGTMDVASLEGLLVKFNSGSSIPRQIGEVVDIEELAITSAEIGEVRQLMQHLTPDQRRVILHRFLEDRSIADTARIMERSEGSVKQLQARALRALGILASKK